MRVNLRRRIQEAALSLSCSSLYMEIKKTETKREETREMGRREMEGRCKVHSSHKQSKGVCPYCLRERLAKLTVNPSSSTAPSPADSSACSVASSAATSSTHEHRSTPMLLRLLKGKKTEALRRSSSLAFALGEPEEQRTEKRKKKKKKEEVGKKEGGSYWFRFIRAGEGRRKEGERGLSHSMTMKEKPSSKWAFF